MGKFFPDPPKPSMNQIESFKEIDHGLSTLDNYDTTAERGTPLWMAQMWFYVNDCGAWLVLIEKGIDLGAEKFFTQRLKNVEQAWLEKCIRLDVLLR
jgi:hypothetical protein